MGRLISMLLGLFAYCCVATVMAAAAGGAYLHFTGKLKPDSLHKMVAVLQGADLAGEKKTEEKPKEDDAEQPSFEELEQIRDLKSRQIELREQSLKSGLDRIRFEKDKLTEEKDRYVRLKNSFEEELEKLQQGSVTAGKENVRLIWENIKPKQAKEQIMQMLEANEIGEVVSIMSAMPIARRAKIIAEFKTPQETTRLGEVLRLIRQGVPQVDLIENAQKQVTQP